MSASPLWISEAEVTALIDMSDAIVALEQGLAREAAGTAANMVKTHASWGSGNTLHAIGATLSGDHVVGTKTWAHTEAGATPLLILFDADNGSLLAVIEAFALGQLRTGGISGLATRWMARDDAREMALIGAGKQAMAQLAGAAAARELRRVRVYSRSAAKAAEFATRAAMELDLAVEPVTSVVAAVEGADIITLITRATAPLVRSAMVTPGAHINAVGAIVPERVEFEPAMLGRCAIVAVDNLAQVRTLSREFMDFYGQDERAWDTVLPLSRLIASDHRRPPTADLTLFKAMGMGLCDLAVGLEVLRRARAAGAGRALPHPQRAKPRLKRVRP